VKLGQVVGRIVATRKDPSLEGQRLLLVQPLDGASQPIGRPQVMVDAVGAGADEVVFWVRGKEASFPFLPRSVPADAAITGIVDHWSCGDRRYSGITKTEP